MSEIGKIKRVLMNPCTPSPMLFVECATPAILGAFWTLIVPDKKELIRISTGKSWLKNLKQTVTEAELKEATWQAQGLRQLFVAAEWADMAVWWYFLADVALEAGFQWTSTVWKQSGCTPGQRQSTVFMVKPFGVLTVDDRWHPAGTWTQEMPTLLSPVAPIINLAPARTGSVGAHIGFTPFIGAVAACSIRLRDQKSGEVLDQHDMTADDVGKGDTAIAFASSITGGIYGRSILLEARATPGPGTAAMAFDNGSLSGYEAYND
ncbi:MAG: hypothetical protein WCB49_13110 [Gammaproteobacteria bacterium]